MLIYMLVIAICCSAGVILSRRGDLVSMMSVLFFVAQVSLSIAAAGNIGQTHWNFFTFDMLGVVYLILMSVMGLLTVWRSVRYLDCESVRHMKIYHLSLIALSLTLSGVYLSNNLAVTWIFLEATTVATAGLTYHRRTGRALEATWKYIFVSSVGIAIAYLGVLLLSTASPDTLSYQGLSAAVGSSTNPLYMKLAFLFILVGYSTKLEIFPLFTVGIDANHAAPAPSSAFISSALVGGGFVALLRVYGVMEHSPEIVWVRGVLMTVALVSIVAGAVYLGRTSNYKRLLAYSTLENSGIMMLGLALGGVGVVAAVMHSLAHTLVKGVMFLQMSVVGRMYRTYKVGRIGSYSSHDGVGAAVMLLALVALVAMPPSLLFRSEYMIVWDLFSSHRWWIGVLALLPLLVCLYWLVSKILFILYRSIGKKSVEDVQSDRPLSFMLLAVLGVVFYFGAFESDYLMWLIFEMIGR